MPDPLKFAPPWGEVIEWREANRTVDYLIRLYKPRLFRAKAIAGDILARFEVLFPLLDTLCANSCPWCPDPCCLAAKVWVDFKDMLFLHLSDQQIPGAQLLNSLDGVCIYWSHRGCTIPRIVRPWICTWYLCPTQKTSLYRNSGAIHDIYSRNIEAIGNGRKEMESEFIRVVSGFKSE